MNEIEVKFWQVSNPRERFELASQYADRNVRIETYSSRSYDGSEGVIIAVANSQDDPGKHDGLIVLRKRGQEDRWLLISDIHTLRAGW